MKRIKEATTFDTIFVFSFFDAFFQLALRNYGLIKLDEANVAF